MHYLETLNPAQRKAVEHKDGPLLVIAGAGAGKTRVLTYRILHLINQGVSPDSILAITFTNKAAKEMRERVVSLLNKRKAQTETSPFVSTFHSLGVALLREHGELLSIPRHFSIYDRKDSLSRVKKALKDAGYDPKQWSPQSALGAISRHKGSGLDATTYNELDERGYWSDVIREVWPRYEKYLREEKAVDFDDLLLLPMKLLRDNAHIRKQYHDRWKYIHIDEYQDTNKVQYELTRLLVAPKENNICIVGDADQSIYGWRGADISNILDFENDFSGSVTVYLEQNYRSTQTILDAANDIISHNTKRKEKNLFTEEGVGEKLRLIQALHEVDEARSIAEKVNECIHEGVDPEEIAILYRTNAQSRALEQAFLDARIPYQLLGTRFFDRKEVKDVLSFIHASLNPDTPTHLERIINVPPRGIGKKTLEKMLEGDMSSVSGARKQKIDEFYALLEKIRNTIYTHKPSKVVELVIRESGMEETFKNGSDEEKDRLENAQELASLALKYDELPIPEGIEKMLEEAALATDADSLEKEESAVKLMTIHASKGLEFDVVFIAGLEEGLFPQERAEGTLDQEEEERRLFYVALTRARRRVYLSFAEARTLFGSRNWCMPSRFLGDISDSLIEKEEDDFIYDNSDGEGLLDLDFL